MKLFSSNSLEYSVLTRRLRSSSTVYFLDQLAIAHDDQPIAHLPDDAEGRG